MTTAPHPIDSVFEKLNRLIVKLRRDKDTNIIWAEFESLVSANIQSICKAANTRTLVSLADTYADHGNPVEKRNALFISTIASMEKLFATRLLIYDISLNKEKLAKLKTEPLVPLWDGMTSFNINQGDMTKNLFRRIRVALADTPDLLQIFETILLRLSENDTVLADMNKYHQRLFATPGRSTSLFRRIKRFWQRLGI